MLLQNISMATLVYGMLLCVAVLITKTMSRAIDYNHQQHHSQNHYEQKVVGMGVEPITATPRLFLPKLKAQKQKIAMMKIIRIPKFLQQAIKDKMFSFKSAISSPSNVVAHKKYFSAKSSTFVHVKSSAPLMPAQAKKLTQRDSRLNSENIENYLFKQNNSKDTGDSSNIKNVHWYGPKLQQKTAKSQPPQHTSNPYGITLLGEDKDDGPQYQSAVLSTGRYNSKISNNYKPTQEKLHTQSPLDENEQKSMSWDKSASWSNVNKHGMTQQQTAYSGEKYNFYANDNGGNTQIGGEKLRHTNISQQQSAGQFYDKSADHQNESSNGFATSHYIKQNAKPSTDQLYYGKQRPNTQIASDGQSNFGTNSFTDQNTKSGQTFNDQNGYSQTNVHNNPSFNRGNSYARSITQDGQGYNNGNGNYMQQNEKNRQENNGYIQTNIQSGQSFNGPNGQGYFGDSKYNHDFKGQGHSQNGYFQYNSEKSHGYNGNTYPQHNAQLSQNSNVENIQQHIQDGQGLNDGNGYIQHKSATYQGKIIHNDKLQLEESHQPIKTMTESNNKRTSLVDNKQTGKETNKDTHVFGSTEFIKHLMRNGFGTSKLMPLESAIQYGHYESRAHHFDSIQSPQMPGAVVKDIVEMHEVRKIPNIKPTSSRI